MEQTIRDMIEKFEKKAAVDEKLQKELEGLVRKVQIDITDGSGYHFTLNETKVEGFGEGEIEEPDVRIIADTETLTGLLSGEIRPMKALATKKLQVKASISDMLAMRKFF